MSKLLKVTSGFTVKEMDDDKGTITIEGYANTTSKDRVGDVVLEEAWTKGGLGNYLKNPIILAFHNHNKPIGTMISHSIDSGGLKITAEISKAAGDIYNLVEANILKAFSIGFRVKDADYDSATDIFVIKDLELMEISVVSVPANADSTFSIMKAVDSSADYEALKTQFTKEAVLNNPLKTDEKSIEEENMTELEKKLADMEAKVKEMEAEKAKTIADEIEAKKVAADAAAVAKIDSVVTGVERLMAEVEKRFEKETADVSDLTAELAEKATEIEAMKNSKMTFSDRGNAVDVTKAEKDSAVLLSIITGKSVEKTRLGSDIIEKVGAHLTGMTANWETEFSTTLENDMRQELKLEPLFRNIAMTAATLNLPINPEAGEGLWVPTGDFGGTNSSGSAAQTHGLSDNILTAHKLASKEYLSYEEEEDAIIPLLPFIRDAIVRRMARSTDIALLRGTGNIAAQPNHDPINGLATIANTAAGVQVVTQSIAAGPVTVAKLQTVRRGMGVWGLNPSDVVYLVSVDVYYDIMEDPDFRTMDLVGSNATILTGQVGAINGSPVVVSGEFEAKAATKAGAVVVNASNFVVGNLRGLLTERDRQIVEQRNVLVTTRRLAFLDVITGKAVAVLNYIA